MGDGRVALILDVLGLAQRSGVVSGVRERALSEGDRAAAPQQAGERQTVLLFATPGGGRMAVPLSLVARLEEFPRSAVERVGGGEVVQYRGEILPLVRVSRVLRRQNGQGNGRGRRAAAAADEKLQVVVYAGTDRRAGLVVGDILDIVEADVTTRSRAGRAGVLFTAVVQDRVTEFLDVESVITAAAATPAGGRA
jgi:two-component system chemotaxis sensor kinase CheA